MLRYEEAPPPEPLRAFVQNLWAFSVSQAPPPDDHHIPPDGCLSLVVTGAAGESGVVVVGPHVGDLAVPLQAEDRKRGVRMRPEAAGLLADLDPRVWVGQVAPLAATGSALAEVLRPASGAVEATFQQLVAALIERANVAALPDPLIVGTVRAIDEAAGDIRVSALAERLGVSVRTLQRRFAAATGLAPKPFIRIRRFRLALANVLRDNPEAWGRVAAEHGYADQAHFAREVAALTGAPPTALHERLDRIEHVGVRP